jgi:hypothetical protein
VLLAGIPTLARNVLAVRLLDDGRSYAYSYERELSQLLVVSGLR